MKKNNVFLLVVIAVVVWAAYFFINGGFGKSVANDPDFLADEQLGAQVGCTTAMKPTLSSISAASVTSNSATLTWTTNIASNSNHRLGLSSSTLGSWQTASETSGVTLHTRPLTGLAPNTHYYYRVRSASTSTGCQSTSSTLSFITQNTSTGVPPTPTNLSAGNLSCNAMTLTWSASAGATGYEVYGPNSACNVNTSAGYCGSTSGTSLPITGLAASTTYSGSTGQTAGFTVLAYNSTGYSSGAPRLTVTTPSCGAVDTTLPAITITAPTSNATYSTSTGTLSLGGTASDNIGVTSVTWTNSAGGSGTATGTTSWSASVALVSGSNVITATARDAANNIKTDVITVTYTPVVADTIAPVTTFSAATNTWTNGNVSRVLTCTDNNGGSGCASTWWKFLPAGTACDDGGYSSGTTSSQTAEGQWRLCTFSLDNANNNESTGPGGIKYTEIFKIDKTAPVGSVSSPTAGATISGTTTLSATGTDALSGIANVVFKIDGVQVGNDATSPYTYAWNTTSATNGSHTLTATETDVAGNVATLSPVTFTVNNVTNDTVAPIVSILVPVNNITVTANPIAISGTATDNIGVASVKYRINSGAEITATGTSSWSGTATLVSGANTISATAYDAAGNASTPVTINVTFTPVTISNISTTNISTGSATISWTTNVASDTQVYYGTTSAYGLSSPLNGSLVTSHSVTLSGLSAGTTYHYQARSNNVVSGDMTFTTLAASYTWAGGIGLDIGTTLTPSNNEPSGLAWTNGNIFSISDGGVLSKITPTGTLLNTWTLPGAPDAEAVTVTNVNSYVYISYENGAGGGSGNPEIREFNPSTGALTGKYWILSGMTVGANAGMEGVTWVPNGHSPYTGTSGGVFYATTENTSARVYVFNVDLSSSAGTTVSPTTSFVAATDGRILNDLYYASDSRTLYAISNGANKLKALNISTSSPTTISDQTIPAEGVGQEGFTIEPTCPSTSTNVYIAEDTGGTNHIVHKYTNYTVTCNQAGDTTPPTAVISVPTNNITVTANPIAISGTAADNIGVTSVKYAVNSGTQSTATGTTSWSGPATLAAGANTISVIAYDAAGNASTAATVNVTYTPADTTPPTISNVSITSIGQTTATVNWTTNENANGYVDFGIGNYNSTVSNPAYATAHSITLAGLTAGSVYQYKIRSSDAAGNQATYTSPTTFTTSPAGGGAWMPDHTVVVVMENKTSNEITSAAAPYIVNTLRPQGRYFSNFYGVITAALGNAHTSQTQYLHLFYGSNLGVTSNSTCLTTPQTAQNIGAELLAAGKSWAWYSESMGTSAASRAITNCSVAGNYQRKHNPAPNSIGTGVNQYDVSHNLDFSSFTSTSFASLPQVSFISPNMCNDMHDCSVATGDAWLQSNFDSYIQWAKNNNSLFVLYFDESNPSGAASDRFYTLMIGPSGHVVPNSTESTTLNHYSMLRFLEDTYGSSTHAGGAATATTFSLQ